MHDPLQDLASLTDALYRAELTKVEKLNAREASLRRDLAELEMRRRNSRNLPHTELTPVRQIGADVFWEGWLSRTHADLNTQLAQVLAQKAHMMAGLRRAFGKQAAAANLVDRAAQEKTQRREKQYRQSQDALQLLKLQKTEW